MNQLKIEFKRSPVYIANKKAYFDGWPVICNEGGSRCFAPETLVHTELGTKPISEIKEGENVLTPKGGKKVLAVHKMANTKKSIEIKMKDGSLIKCTEDHKFFYQGRWHEIKDLLSLRDEINPKF